MFTFIFPLLTDVLCRKKLEPQAEKNLSRVEYTTDVRDVHIPDGDSELAVTEAPPWADQYEISATEMSGQITSSHVRTGLTDALRGPARRRHLRRQTSSRAP